MAEEDNKNIQNDSANVNKADNKPAKEQGSKANPNLAKKKPRRRRRPRKPNTKQTQPKIEETKFEVPEAAFLASDDKQQNASAESPAEPKEAKKSKEYPSSFKTGEQAKGPVGWDQLKNAIKEDYEQTKDEVAPAPVSPPPPLPETQETEVKEKDQPSEIVEPVEQAEEVKPVEPMPVETPSPVSVSHPELSADEEAEKKEIIKIITKYALGGCLIIAIIASIFLFKLPQRIFGLIEGISSETTPQEQVETTQEPDQKIESSTDIETDEYEEGVGTALVTGESIPKIKRASSAVQTLYKIGLPEITGGSVDIISSYMQTLTRLQNAFTTDIHQLLENSTNRAQALQVHLSELNVAFDEAQRAYEELSTERDDLKELFNETTTEKDELEEAFFTATNNLRGLESNEILIKFIDASQRQIELKAGYNALSRLKEMYEVALANMEARIKDIELNKSALIKGVQVIDIKGSDLELIIQEGEL